MGYTVDRLDPISEEALRQFGLVLRDLRTRRGLSQEALAGRAGISQSTVSRLETGIARGVRIRVLARLLGGLEAPVADLDPWVRSGFTGWRGVLETFAPGGPFADVVEAGRRRGRALQTASLDAAIGEARRATAAVRPPAPTLAYSPTDMNKG